MYDDEDPFNCEMPTEWQDILGTIAFLFICGGCGAALFAIVGLFKWWLA